MVDQEEYDYSNDDNLVLKIDSSTDEAKPYYTEGYINGNKFRAMIASGSPVTFFAVAEVKRMMKREKLDFREVISKEKYVD